MVVLETLLVYDEMSCFISKMTINIMGIYYTKVSKKYLKSAYMDKLKHLFRHTICVVLYDILTKILFFIYFDVYG